MELKGKKAILGIFRDITERKQAEEALRRFRAALDMSADAIFLIDRATMRFVDMNEPACASTGYTREELLAMGPQDIKPDYERDQLADKFDELIQGAAGVGVIETVHRRKDGSRFPAEVFLRCFESDGRPLLIAAARDITERKRAEAELEALNQQVAESSRQAGRAEMASSVLHNVGNVLNSVNVSAALVTDKVRKSKVSGLVKAADLMRDRAEDLGTFITEDEKGKQLPGYLAKLAGHLANEQDTLLQELGSLAKNMEHIKSIVSTQQSYAGVSAMVESVSIADVLEDALKLSAASFGRSGIQVVREYGETPAVALEKHKLLQILVNLVRNAKHALVERGGEDKRLTLRIAPSADDCMRIEVIDNGVGISQENLTRMFSHGFTTKKDGHGFGLHSSAQAAKGMGGSLTVHSDGSGKGATFTLELPLQPVARPPSPESASLQSTATP